jgi:hypothetical protein
MNPRLLVIVLLAHVASAHGQTPPRSLLTDPQAWKSVASEGADIQIRHESSASGAPVLRIDFDFTKGAGYGGVALELPIDLPENYEFTLTLRGEGPVNNLELKLVDPQGLNVWWVNRRAFELPAESTRLVNRRRHFQFAWGPSGGKALTQLGRIELVIAANEGGRGTLWIEDLRFATLPAEKPYTGTPVLSASSGALDRKQLQMLMEGTGQLWKSDRADLRPWLAVDFGQPRDLGGVVVHRPQVATSTDFDVEISDDGKEWTPVRRVRGATSLPSELGLPDLQCRWLRLVFIRSGDAPEPVISRIQFLDSSVGASPNALWRSRAARASRGIYPRTLLNEQSYWTVIGQPGDDREAIINEEGMVEIDRRGFSLDPFIVRQGKVLTWADGTHSQSLRDGWIPIPSVVRRHEGIQLAVTAFASGEPGASSLQVSYTVRNTSTKRTSGVFVLGVRPLQVLPPWQELNITGGWTPIRSIRVDPDGMLVNKQENAKRILVSPPARSAAMPYDSGDPIEMLAGNVWPESEAAQCPQRSASGVLGWEFDLPPGASRTFLACVPFHGVDPPPDRPRDAAAFEVLASKVAVDWNWRVERVKFRLPESARQFHDTIRATQAYILINHDGQGFQPGSRTYNRSWMRDGSMTSAAMLELGHTELVRQFIDWYAPHQFPSGKVPCVVDRRGADPVNEHDSNGQLLWLFANYHRYSGDVELVRRHFPRVKATVEYIESLRAQRLTDKFGLSGVPRQAPGKPAVPALAFRGLVPESISHEGYSAKPMHSFWDTLFILRGLKDAAYLARVAGEPALAQQWQHLADDFRDSIIKSIRIAQEAHGIDYLPGCVELGDFDSTSSTILLWPVDEGHNFPASWIKATFDRYWSEFTRRRDELPPTWSAYTPYELRHVGAYVRMGEKQRAWETLNWFFTHQRPAGWRQWAEVVHREPGTPRMIGDMPHTWCGSDYLNAARAMFVHEDPSENRLIVFAGVPDEWFFDPAGVEFDGLPTEFGTLSASAEADGADRVIVRLDGTARPAGGFELCLPTARHLRRVNVDQREVSPSEGNRIRLNTLPATIQAELERR